MGKIAKVRVMGWLARKRGRVIRQVGWASGNKTRAAVDRPWWGRESVAKEGNQGIGHG